MKCPMIPDDEEERLAALRDYGLDEEQELPSLQPVVTFAVRLFQMPVSVVNMVGRDHVFFAASAGAGKAVARSRDVSFCAHAITQNGVMVVADAREDERFFDNPLVTGPLGLRFYAGVPIRSPEGHALGALCLIDSRPHLDFSAEDRARLCDLAAMASDRLELRRIETATMRSGAALEERAQASESAVVWFDPAGTILRASAAAARLFGRPEDAFAGQPLAALVAARDRRTLESLMRRVAGGAHDAVLVPARLAGHTAGGAEIALGCTLARHEVAGAPRCLAIFDDLSRRHREDEELHRLANFDALTGLPNRSQFYRSVEAALLSERSAAVAMIDIDGLKDINSTLGPAAGDEVLRLVAGRLVAAVGSQDKVARVGGDEFAVLAPDLDGEGAAQQIARRVLGTLTAPMVIEGQDVRLAVSCGVSFTSVHAKDAMELISDADLALHSAKTEGLGPVVSYRPDLRTAAVARRLSNMELHRAEANGEFILFYQPQIRLGDRRLVGAEALIRWLHPTRGLLAPGTFLPALEGGPLAPAVGSWVLEEACAQAAAWWRRGVRPFRMAVNVFGAQFRAGDLPGDVAAALAGHGLPPEALEIEITENIVLNHDDVALAALERIRAQGVEIAFDDFGTGFASLSLLTRYPLTRIKIDRSFVHSMLQSPRDASIVNAILDMARNLGLSVTAEGIEVPAQLDCLKARACPEGQGYLFGKPMPASAFEAQFGLAPVRRRAAAR